MTPLLIIWTLTAALAAAGITWTIRLVRAGGRSWHPGDPLPAVPPDAPLRTWHDAGMRRRSHPATDRRAPARTR